MEEGSVHPFPLVQGNETFRCRDVEGQPSRSLNDLSQMVDTQLGKQFLQHDGLWVGETHRVQLQAYVLVAGARMRTGRPFDEGGKEPAFRERTVAGDGEPPRPVAPLEMNDFA